MIQKQMKKQKEEIILLLNIGKQDNEKGLVYIKQKN